MSVIRSPILAILAALLVALTGQSLAVARGASDVAGQIEICSGSGPVMIYVDADGQPVAAPRYCPEAALSLLATVWVSSAQPAMPQGAARSVQIPVRALEPRPSGQRPKARAPPVSI